MLYRALIILILTLSLVTTAAAGIRPKSFTLSPLVGEHFFAPSQQRRNSFFGSLGLGYNLTDHAALEAVFSQVNTDGKNVATSDAKVRIYRIDALYHFLPQRQLVPYLAVGFGEINTNPQQGHNAVHLLADIGGGIKYFLNEQFALRADLRYLYDFPATDSNLVCSTGLLIQFGQPPATPAPLRQSN